MMKMSPRGLLSSADAGILQSFGQNILSNNLALVFESTYVVRFVALLPCPYQLFLAYKRRLTPPCSLAVNQVCSPLHRALDISVL